VVCIGLSEKKGPGLHETKRMVIRDEEVASTKALRQVKETFCFRDSRGPAQRKEVYSRRKYHKMMLI
jgi:hypothetical protein